MNARFVIFASAALSAGAPVAADPPKVPPREIVQPHGQAREVVLAAADAVPTPTPAPDQQSPAAPKRPRFTRVTSCRCGDPQAQPEE